MVVTKEPDKFIDAIERHHTQRVYEQGIDQKYFDDDFETNIKSPFHVVRTGAASRLVSNIVAHLETSNPQVRREPRSTGSGARESAVKVSRFLNYLVRCFIQEINESTWNAVLRGEAVYQIEFNKDAYESKQKDFAHKLGELPVLVSAVDPINVFCQPYDILLPARVAKVFEVDDLTANELIPEVKLDKTSGHYKYKAYADAQTRFYTIEQQVNQMANILGFCPYVHFYAGYGKRSPEGKPEEMAVGRLRRSRGLLKEECEAVSRFDSIVGIYANPIYRIKQTKPDATPMGDQKLRNLVIGPGAVLKEPYGWEGEFYVPNLNIQQLSMHIAQIRSAIGLEDPPVMSGLPASSHTTGRMEDIEFSHAFKKNLKLIQNHEAALAMLLGRCLQVLDTVPSALPITFRGEVIKDGISTVQEDKITKDDIAGYYDCEVSLNPDEDMEANTKFMKYRMLVNEGRISWKRFLMDGLGKDEYEADEIMAESIAEQTIMTNPMMQQIRASEAIDRMGATRYLQKLGQGVTEQAQMQQAVGEFEPRYRPTEATNPEAAGTLRQVLSESPRAPRSSPQQ